MSGSPSTSTHWDVLQFLMRRGGTISFFDVRVSNNLDDGKTWGSLAYLMKHKLVGRNFNTEGVAEYFATPMAAQFSTYEDFERFYQEQARLRGKGVYKNRIRKPGPPAGKRRYTRRYQPQEKQVAVAARKEPLNGFRAKLNGGVTAKIHFQIGQTSFTLEQARQIYKDLQQVFG